MTATLLDFSAPHVLRNAREYRAAAREIDALLDAEPGRRTPEWDRLRFLAVLVEAYDDAHDPLARYEAGGSSDIRRSGVNEPPRVLTIA